MAKKKVKKLSQKQALLLLMRISIAEDRKEEQRKREFNATLGWLFGVKP